MGATGQTGSFQGHAIPASFFFCFGVFFLVLTLRRARSLPPGASFAEAHIPEKNMPMVHKLSVILIVCTALGGVYEGIGGIINAGNFFNQVGHETLYTMYFFVGVVMLLESGQRLPADSSRSALSLALFLEYVLWYDHAIMKNDGTDRHIHVIMALICLAGSVVTAGSVCKPSSVAAYVGGWGMMVLQSFWLITAGINAEFYAIHRHDIGVLLCLEILAIVSIVILGFVCCGPPLRMSEGGYLNGVDMTSRPGRSERKEYETLHLDDDEGENEV
eukprot:CAMPEP_0113599504 /NCGR_PEP_ID=MMETSP0015_2-20120614/42181_1 /TAXON_ID=2838 /ORGANISM="Odontella" /LENGTH=273 /DNA_ID=CAMNT_0000507643 /DNA_START=169 /DNA_END=990 /DNA_ORIENTATION=+ /assembly_acc=CAM_ASM_000160